MDISIVVVNYNTKKETAECIKSCLNERSGCKSEIIVIDNGSDDGSAEFLIKNFIKNKTVRIIKNDENEGFSKAVNIGLNKSKGRFKYLLNSDTKVTKNIFSTLIQFSEQSKNTGVIGTKLILPDGSIQKSCFNFPGVINAIEEYWLGRIGKYTSFFTQKMCEVDSVVGASFFITPEAYKKAGLFDERYFMYFEDLDYCRRVKNVGFKVIYYPKVEVMHYHGLSGKKLGNGQIQRNRLIASSKIYHGTFMHYLINFVLWSGQKMRSIINQYEG